MTSDKATAVCLVVFALVVSGCSGREGDDNVELPNDDVIDVDSPNPIVIEVPLETDTDDSIATPVTPVSSFELDGFIVNPLLTAIPSEVGGGSSSVVSREFAVNPLTD